TLIEGHVVVLPQGAGTRSVGPAAPGASAQVTGLPVTPADKGRGPGSLSRIVLDAGEQLVLSRTAPPNILHVNVDRATAWAAAERAFRCGRLFSRIGGGFPRRPRLWLYEPRKLTGPSTHA